MSTVPYNTDFLCAISDGIRRRNLVVHEPCRMKAQWAIYDLLIWQPQREAQILLVISSIFWVRFSSYCLISPLVFFYGHRCNSFVVMKDFQSWFLHIEEILAVSVRKSSISHWISVAFGQETFILHLESSWVTWGPSCHWSSAFIISQLSQE